MASPTRSRDRIIEECKPDLQAESGGYTKGIEECEAHTDLESGGYECELVQKPPIQTECSMCLLVLRSPHITSCCGHNFCKECIERVRKAGKGCPLCNKDGFTLVYNRALDISLQGFEVYCTHRKLGCGWKGKLESLDNHLNVNPGREKQLEGCTFVEVQCYCGKSFKRELVDQHQSKECPLRSYTCEHCHEYKNTFYDVTSSHWPVCESYPVICPNRCTTNKIMRRNLEMHLENECPLQVIECDFKFAGCMTKLPRKEMPHHIHKPEQLIYHVSLLAQQNKVLLTNLQQKGQQIEVLTQRLAEKDKQIEQISQMPVTVYPAAPVRIVMTSYKQHKRNNDMWYSKGFYSHREGYKMCLRVYANGEGYDKGSHLSCFLCLMHGDFDDKLKWPCKKRFGIVLLNQNEDKGHHVKIFNFTSMYGQRVTSGETGVGQGFYSFIPLTELWYNPTTDCQYLLNDCLHFQVELMGK